jgi:polyferredoxin
MKFLRDNRLFLVLFIPFIIIPWISIDGLHLLLFNFPQNRLEFFFMGIEIGTYALIGIIVFSGFGIAIITALTLSRFYCGILCPNTFFTHLLTLFGKKKTSIITKIGGFTLLTALGSLLAFSVVAYGISPDELIESIVRLSFAGWLVITLSLLMIAEVYMIQGWYCAYLCPYGATCAILSIEDRLSYEYNDPQNDCTDCGGCVKICPIPDLDIRQGFDLRCIQCGLCEAACEKTFAKSPSNSLIHHNKRSVLRAGGREKGVLIALVAIILFMFGGVIFLSDSNRLDSCRLENQNLHINNFKGEK